MPLYEYECESCGSRFEVIQRFSDAPVAACRRCAGPVHRLLSAPAIQFKGTGWYVTDYRKSGSGKEPSSESQTQTPAATDTSSGGDKKTSDATAGTSSSTDSAGAAKKD